MIVWGGGMGVCVCGIIYKCKQFPKNPSVFGKAGANLWQLEGGTSQQWFTSEWDTSLHVVFGQRLFFFPFFSLLINLSPFPWAQR